MTSFKTQLENAIKGEESLHKSLVDVNSLHDRPVLSQQFAFQPVCRCHFTFGNFPFVDETDLMVKFTSSRWDADHLEFVWSDRLGHNKKYRQNYLSDSVDKQAIGGTSLVTEIDTTTRWVAYLKLFSPFEFDGTLGPF